MFDLIIAKRPAKRMGVFAPAALFLAIFVATSQVSQAQSSEGQEAQGRPAVPRTDHPEEIKRFEDRIRPLLLQHCVTCHGPTKSEAGLRLDQPMRFAQGGDSGPLLDSDQPLQSLILQAVRHEDGLKMPPNKQLSDGEISSLEAWVRAGAVWPEYIADSGSIAIAPGGLGTERITQADREYWFFQPLTDSAVPASPHANPIDAFVDAKLQSKGLKIAEPAELPVLIRRVYLDLVGLPPTRAEWDAFLATPEIDVDGKTRYEQLVDRLLADPRYGERWGRYWLDLVRFAESDGFKQDAFRGSAYRYRDYVIQSLNEDLPYGQFVLEQLAGDEIEPDSDRMNAATGYLRHWIYEYNQRDVRSQWDNILNDLTDVTGEVFLGLGFSCARCHDHKFDPLLQADYYRLQACFAPIEPRYDIPSDRASYQAWKESDRQWSDCAEPIQQELDAIQRQIRENVIESAIAKFPPDVRPALIKPKAERSPDEKSIAVLAYLQIENEIQGIDFSKKLQGETLQRWQSLKKQLDELKKSKPIEPEMALTVRDGGRDAPKVAIPGKESIAIEPGIPSVLSSLAHERYEQGSSLPVLNGKVVGGIEKGGETTGRRTALARWITNPENPLSWRVVVNRVWQHHFGKGLVANASDFGRLGEPPTHPELLDYLAQNLIDNGGKLKSLHRLIVNSKTYRQRSYPEGSSQAFGLDPENRFLWRYSPHRMDAEQLRDSILLVSRELDDRMGGPSDATDSNRRSIYQRMMRNTPHTLLVTFDAPDGSSTVAKRNTTTTSLQSLFLMNATWMDRQGNALAKRLIAEHETARARIDALFREVLMRAPSEDEVRWIEELLEGADPDSVNVWGEACQSLWNSSEFLYVE